jgi:hypothetical protein
LWGPDAPTPPPSYLLKKRKKPKKKLFSPDPDERENKDLVKLHFFISSKIKKKIKLPKFHPKPPYEVNQVDSFLSSLFSLSSRDLQEKTN